MLGGVTAGGLAGPYAVVDPDGVAVVAGGAMSKLCSGVGLASAAAVDVSGRTPVAPPLAASDADVAVD